MLIRCGYEIAVRCEQPTPIITMLSVHPDRQADLRGPERFHTTPDVPTSTYLDSYGNRCRRLVAPAGLLDIWGDATVADDGLIDPADFAAREVPVPELPDETLLYLLGSRYCETDELGAAAWERFGHVPAGRTRVQAICDFVHHHVTFDYLQARATRTAAQTMAEGVGVCRDYAHLMVALCRCLNIPARYVNGHLGDIGIVCESPMDFHAWVEVFLGDRWFTFDPRNNQNRIGRIVISRGRDAADTSLLNSFGPHELASFRVWTYEVDTATE